MSKDKTHEIKESRIKELAEKCSSYKQAMKVLFPEAFRADNDVTAECSLEFFQHQNGEGARIRVSHNGKMVLSTDMGSQMPEVFRLPFYGYYEKGHKAVLVDSGIKIIKE